MRISINEKTNIRSITVERFLPTPSKEKVVERENILQQDFYTAIINEKWVRDITYIYTLKQNMRNATLHRSCICIQGKLSVIHLDA